MTMMVCIWFPQWSLQRLLWKHPDFPPMLRSPAESERESAEQGREFAERRKSAEQRRRPSAAPSILILHSPPTGRGARVLDCSLAAWQRGVRVNMPLAEAQALVEPFQKTKKERPLFFLHDPAADRAGLQELAGSCEKYSPIYGVEESESPECLLLDVTGCASLFGGEQALVERIQEDFQESGWQVRVAAAPTIGAAWAVAHGVSRSNQAVVVPDVGLAETLDTLPVQMLRLPEATVRTLSELGIHGVGQLRGLPRKQLPSRFGSLIIRRLAEAFGQAQELIVVERPREPLVATWATQEPLRDRLVLLEICSRLLKRMLAPLEAKRRGVRRLLCQLRSCGGRPCELSVGTLSPTHSAAHLCELLELQLQRVAWEDEITFVRLEAAEVAPLEERPRDLFGEPFEEDHTAELRWLLERLSNRLGVQAVVRAACAPDPQPELAVTYRPWVASEKMLDSQTTPPLTVSAARPLRLFTPPSPIEVLLTDTLGPPHKFFWNQRDLHVRQVWGPERIETGWWRGSPVRRDYYRVEVTSGERYWLFQNAEGWFLHGVFE